MTKQRPKSLPPKGKSDAPSRGRKAPFGGAPVERLTAFLPVSLAAAIRVAAVKEKKTISEIVAELAERLEV